jgi:putative inorganic carbon (hco3(-)) transporter
MNVPLWILLIMVCASLGVTFDIRFSLGKVSGVFLGSLLFWAIVRWLTTTRRLVVAAGTFLLAGAVLAVLGLLGTEGSDKLSGVRLVTARLPQIIRGVPGAEDGFNPNAVSGCLVLFVPLQVVMLVRGRLRELLVLAGLAPFGRWLTAAQAALLALTTGTLLLMQSRGAWAGVAVAAIAFLLWHSRGTRVVAAIASGGTVVLATAFHSERLVDLAISRSGAGMNDTISGRLELWSRAVYGIQDLPFTGMGMNAFRRIMPVLYPPQIISPETDVAHAHNHLLQAALDLGIPGLVAYCAIWLVVGSLLVRVYRRSSQPVYRAMAGGLGAGLIAHFMFGMTDAIPLGAKVGVLFWMSLALAVGLHQVAIGGKQGKSPAPHQSD